MADEKKPKEPKVPKERKKAVEPAAEGGILADTAKAIGAAAGKIAALAGAVPLQRSRGRSRRKCRSFRKRISPACRAGKRKPSKKLLLTNVSGNCRPACGK